MDMMADARKMGLAVCAVAGISAAGALCAAPAQAQPSQAQMEAITVYATRSPQPVFGVPAMVSRQDASAPGAALAHNLADFLTYIPGVNLDGGPRRNGQTLSVRGFDDEAILTLLDGRRQNFESEHDGRMFVDPALLKSVELVRGASSAIYGGGAIGGVAAYETKDAADLLPPGQNAGAFVTGGFRSGNTQYATSLAGYARSDNWDMVGAFAWRKSGDIEQGGGGKLLNDENLLSGMIKLGVSFADYHTVKLQTLLFNNQGREPNNGQQALSSTNTLVDKDVRDNQISLKYAYANPNLGWLKPQGHLYYNNTRVDEDDVVGAREQSRILQTIGFALGNISQWTLSPNHAHRFAYGFEIYRDRQDGQTSAAAIRPGVPDAEALNYGFYVQDEAELKSRFGKILFIPALRLDSYRKEDEGGRSQARTEFSPKVSLSYLPLDGVMLFASWAQAFRAPNLTETFAAGQHFPGGPPDVAFGVLCGPPGRMIPARNARSIMPPPRPGDIIIGGDGSRRRIPVPIPTNNFQPNPGLKSETVRTVEVGAGLRGGARDALPGEAEVKGSWFQSDGRDFIAQSIDICAGTTRYLNVPKARLRGWEVTLTYAFRAMTARLSGFAVEAKDTDSGAYISNNVPLTLLADIGFALERFDSELGWRGRFAQANDKVAPTDVPTASYAVHDIYWRWTPRFFGPRKPLQLDFSIENVLDESYQKRFVTLTEEGRSFNLRLALQW